MKITGVICLFAVLIISYILWQKQELKKFKKTDYELYTDKLTGDLTVILIADLHLWEYGKENEPLLEKIREQKPDLILIAGDLIVSTKPQRFFVAENFCRQLVAIAPVYFSNGNHEKRVLQPEHASFPAYQKLLFHLLDMGVHVLNNQSVRVDTKAGTVIVYGLDLPLSYYSKKHDIVWNDEELTKDLGDPKAGYRILLAHNPKYTKEYLDWGADLSVSGHYHGGLVCLPKIGSVISPQFDLFPKYSFGMYQEKNRAAVTSRGLGTHTFHIRIGNRSELPVIVIHGKK